MPLTLAGEPYRCPGQGLVRLCGRVGHAHPGLMLGRHGVGGLGLIAQRCLSAAPSRLTLRGRGHVVPSYGFTWGRPPRPFPVCQIRIHLIL